jgi:signal peptide peptidase SppA
VITRALHVPQFRRLDQYVGAWAIEPSRGAALWELARGTNLAAHVEESPPRPRSQAEKVNASGSTVAVIRVAGVLMKQASSMSAGTSTVQLRRDIRQAAADPDVSAILLAIDSPGGTVAGVEDLARDVQNAKARKPVWAFIDDLGASAAYWIASQAEKVFANGRTALVGSIGTLMTVYDLSGMAEQQGIKALVYSTGPLKGAGTEGAPVTPEQSAYFQGIVNDAQSSFDAAVKKGRGLSSKQLDEVRSGAVFGAEDALSRKLIDGIQSLDATLEALAKTARKGQRAAQYQGATMFETWLKANGFDEATLSAAERIQLLEMFRAEQAQTSAAAAAPASAAAAGPSLTVSVSADVEQARQQLAAETERIAAIRRVCAEAGSPTILVEGQQRDLAAHAIGSNWDATRTELQVLRQSRPSPAVIVRSHDRDCSIEAMQGAMILRAGGRLDHPAYQSLGALALGVPQWMRLGINADQRQRAMEAAHRYSDLSAVDICREAVRLSGRDIPTGRKDLIRAAFSGGALNDIFTTNVNAILLTTYQEAGDTTGGWTSTVDVGDFKTNERPRLAKGPNLEKLPRGGEADHYERSDVAESYKIARYAKQFVVDEQDMIDDRLDAFSDMPREMGLAAARLRPDLVYAILLRNAALVDTIALFHASHSNLNTGAALASTTLRACIAALEKQRENSVNLNLRATHLLVPSDLKHLGAELINSSTLIAGGDTGVAVRGSANPIATEENLTLVSDARLSNGVTDPVDGSSQSGSTSTWYVASSMGHNIEVGYLRGTGRAPQVRSFVLSEGKWGMGWDINMDIGAKSLDYRGMQKNTA